MTPRFTLSISATLFVLSGVLSFTAAANAGGVDVSKITRGNVSFSQDGNRLVVRASNGSIIEYNRFSIEAGQIMQFIQPSSTSRVLNRVTGAELSRIDGTLLSNGIVYLVNPQGIRINNGALINVGGFYAAAGAMSDNDFVRGQNNFTNLSGKVTNEGMIQGQSVALVGQYVANHGTINVDDGMVAMAAGDTVYLQNGSAPIMVTVSRSAMGADGSGAGTQAAVSNTGTINAGKGKVAMASGDFYALAMDLSGTIIGKSIEARGGAGNAPGNGGVVAVNGTLDASSSTDKGGTIDLFGERVGLFGNALVNANGATGGGNVRIGGDYLGSNAENTPQAKATYIDSNARVTANATQSGDGGRVIVWSNEYTGFFGSIEASAVGSGNGGFVETSSHDNLQAFGSVTASSVLGAAGTWLMDPANVEIVAGSSGTLVAGVFNPGVSPATLGVDQINASLDGGTSVIINTASGTGGEGNITLAAAITKAAGGDATLTLNAVGSITLNDSITSTVGALSVALNAGTTVSMGAITTNGGSVSVNAGGGVVLAGNITAGGMGAINITGNTNVNLALRSDVGATVNSGVTIRTTNGNLIITGTGGEDVGGKNYGVYNVGTITSSGSGNVTVTGNGGNGADGENYGVLNEGVNSANKALITSGGGNVVVTGTGGTSTNATSLGVSNDGIYMINGEIKSGFNGTVTVTGIGGESVAGRNDGIRNKGTITSGGMGEVIVSGTGGTSTGDVVSVPNSNYGIINKDGAIITSGGGAVTVTGVGGNGVDGENYGVQIMTLGTITSGGTGSVTVTGTGGSGSGGLGKDNYGVYNFGSSITSGGDLTITGNGGNGVGGFNTGVYSINNLLANGAITSGGNVVITGTGGDGVAGFNAGVYTRHTEFMSSGSMAINGEGGTGGFNVAIVLVDGPIHVGGNFSATTSVNAGSSNSKILIETPITTTNGGAVDINARVGSLSIEDTGVINSDGVVNLTAGGGISTAGDVTTTGHDVNYNSATTLTGDILVSTGAGDINFFSTLDSGPDSHGIPMLRDLTLTAGTGNIAFEGAIGGTLAATQLGTITVDCGNNFGNTITFGALASTVRAVDVRLNTNTILATPATVATIIARNNIAFSNTTFAMGQNHKITSFGDVVIGGLTGANAATVSVGDVNAVGDLRVNANSITLLGRAGGTIATNTGGVVNDPQVDYVVGGRVYFSVAPIMGGSNPGNRAVFSNPTGNVDALGTLGAYAKTMYQTSITAGLLSGAGTLVLDLSAASGVSYINPAMIIPQAMSSTPPIGLLGDADTLDKEDDAAVPVADDQATEPISTPTQTEKTATDVPVNAIGAAVPVALR